MTFPNRSIFALALLLLLPSAALYAVQSKATQPNILFIMADDQGPWAFGASGNSQAPTPNMDRLAREGMRFTNALTPTPVCSPARASILCSRYGSELGITDWINPATDKGIGIDPNLPTWPRLLQQAGYSTALFGKWHVGDLATQHPTRIGYQNFMGFVGGGQPPKNPTLEKDGITAKREGFIVDIVADEAIAWLKTREASKPFAASIHFREPHAAYLPVRDEDWAKVKDLDLTIPNPDFPGLDVERVRKNMREYLASVVSIDRNLGRILQTLDQLNLTENTLVIYTSDHGYNIGHHGLHYKGNAQWLLKPEAKPPGTPNVPKGERPNMFDTSLHVPMCIRWPGIIKAGAVNAHVISHLDWLPTFATLGGFSIPSGTIIRGRDITPLLRDQAKTWDDDFYAEYSMKHGAKVHMRTLRTPQWKLTRDFNNPGRDELYHLATDPDETHNLIDDPDPAARNAAAELHARIVAKMKDLNDPVLALTGQKQGE